MADREGLGAFPECLNPARLKGLVASFAAMSEVTYAEITERPGSSTDWELSRGVGSEDYLRVGDAYLRGFAWITYCALGLLEWIGGVEGARLSGAFWRVQEINGDLVCLQATERMEDYSGERVTAVQDFLEPILVPRPPRRTAADAP